jgi:hypothetical protein
MEPASRRVGSKIPMGDFCIQVNFWTLYTFGYQFAPRYSEALPGLGFGQIFNLWGMGNISLHRFSKTPLNGACAPRRGGN